MTQTETKEVAGFETTQRTELEKIYKWIFVHIFSGFTTNQRT